ncbi:MAG: hypothetical protein AAGK01_11925 [Pseudomonadota bacterium]
MSKITYQTRMRWLAVLCAAATIIYGISVGYLTRLGGPGEYFWIVFPALLVLSLGLFALVWQWWERLDDVQKGGHLTSWYWGGCAGAFVFIVWLIAAREQHSDFGLGAATMFGIQFVGFALVWLVWKVRGLGASE